MWNCDGFTGAVYSDQREKEIELSRGINPKKEIKKGKNSKN